MKITKEILAEIEIEAKRYFKNASGCHDWTHVERVRSIGIRLAKEEKADRGIVEAAAMLHDIRKNDEMRKKGSFCHAESGAKEADKILKKIGLDERLIERIVHCIRTHRKRKGNAPVSPEAKILFDADKIDSIGAVGVGRLYYFASSMGARLYTGKENEHAAGGSNMEYTADDSAYHEYLSQIRYLKDKMLTRTGKRIAAARHKYMAGYFKQFWDEVEGRK